MEEKRMTMTEINRLIKELDIYSRIYIGQYEELFRLHNWNFSLKNNTELRHLCHQLRQIIIPSLYGCSFYASLGIWGVDTPINAKRAYDIQQILRYQMAYYDSPEGGHTVYFNNPLIHGKWKASKENLKVLDDVIEKYNYPDYKPRGFYQHAWECPLIITQFNNDEVVILRDAKKIDRYIEDAHQFYVYLDNNQIYKAFLLLYPHMKENHLMKELCIAIEKENRRII